MYENICVVSAGEEKQPAFGINDPINDSRIQLQNSSFIVVEIKGALTSTFLPVYCKFWEAFRENI